VKPGEIYGRMRAQYGCYWMRQREVYESIKNSKEGG
jgi:hypothetical protein